MPLIRLKDVTKDKGYSSWYIGGKHIVSVHNRPPLTRPVVRGAHQYKVLSRIVFGDGANILYCDEEPNMRSAVVSQETYVMCLVVSNNQLLVNYMKLHYYRNIIVSYLHFCYFYCFTCTAVLNCKEIIRPMTFVY